jgi:hypothetical protein
LSKDVDLEDIIIWSNFTEEQISKLDFSKNLRLEELKDVRLLVNFD